jgi:hypothetical protein
VQQSRNEAERARISQANSALAARRNLAQGTTSFAVSLSESLSKLDIGATKEYREAKAEELARQVEAQEKFNDALRETAERARELDPAFRFMRGLRGETDAVASSFERLGQNIGDSFRDLRGLLSSLGSAVKQFFGDLMSATLRNVAASALAPLAGKLGGIFPSGSGGNIFTTPGINPAASIPSLFGFGNGFGSSVSAGFFNPGVSGLPSLPRPNPGFQEALQRYGIGGFGGGLGVTPPAKFSLAGLKGSLASALPFLGLSIGSSLGGKSLAGNILGGIGGTALGLFGAASLAPSLFGATAVGLLSNPITAIAGAALLVGGIFLGKSKQRREDEQLADSYWSQYKDRLITLTKDVRANRIDGDSALSEALAARQQAIDQINTIKTKSVRESRLKNQISDVDRVFLEPLKRAVSEQKRRRDFDSTLIPEFASGGIIPGRIDEARYVLAHGGEIVVNRKQQTPALLEAASEAGVPGVRGNASAPNYQPNIHVEVLIGKDKQDQLFINGVGSSNTHKALKQTLATVFKYG